MTEFITSFLKNLGCSHCQEFEFEDNYSKENYKNWKLYLKEYEMYSAMILYNDNLKKDISCLINKNETVVLLNQNNNEVFLKLEYILNNDTDKNSILVPTDEFEEIYEKNKDIEI